MSNFTTKLKKKIEQKKYESLYNHYVKKKEVIHTGTGSVTIRSKEWVERGGEEYVNTFKRENTESVKGNIKKEDMLSLTSQCKDWFLELQLRSEKYTFNSMLAVVDPFDMAPLTAVVLFTTMMDYRVRVTVLGDKDYTNFVSEYPATKRHRIPIVGLYAGRSTKVRIELIDENDEVCDSQEFALTTEALPEALQDVIKVKKVNPDSAFANILVAGGIDIHPCVFDREGQIRYYLKRKPKGYGIFPLSKGRFLFMEREISAPSFTNPHAVQMYDMDYLGRVGRTYLVKNGAHHTVEEKTENGNILTAGNSMEGHSEDLILEIDRENGQIVHKIKVGDLFDDKYQDMMDWAHINSASYDVEQDSMLVSMRNIHSVAKFDWSTNELKWLMADPRFWAGTSMEDKLLTPIGEVPWFYQQHAVFEVPLVEDKPEDVRYIMVYDNHWHKRRKVKFFDKDKASYVSFYEINENEKTVKLYKRIKIAKTKIRSNAVFDSESRHLYSMAGYLVPEVEENLGWIQEFDFDSEKVLSEYYVKPGFFRAHEFKPDMVSLSKPLTKNNDYLCGDLKRPEKMEDAEAVDKILSSASNGKPAGVKFRRQEDLLYIHETDHLVKNVYFAGKEQGLWKVDYADTYQTMDTFRKAEYRIVMWMDSLPADQYEIYLETEDAVFHTAKKITKM